jgi:hypothetical protein
MKKTIGMFLVIFILTGFGCLLMSDELLDLEIEKTPTYKEVGGVWYAYMDLTCPKYQMREKALAFHEECDKQGIKSNWILMFFYTWSENEQDVIKWTRSYIVPEGTKVKEPLKIAKLEKFKAWVYTHTGIMKIPEIAKSNKFLSDFLIEKGLKEIRPNIEVISLKPPQVLHLWYMVEDEENK